MCKIKICGLTNIEDASAAVDFGADALGFIFYPKSPRSVRPERAKEIISSLPPFITTVGVFVDETTETIMNTVSYAGLDAVQLHGSEPPETCRISRKTIKAFRVKDFADLSALDAYAMASAFLLDTYDPNIVGGTGKVFNWDIAKEAKKSGRIILAGGLNPGNVEDAIRTVLPYGIDVSSGIESSKKGVKDREKMRLFMQIARRTIHDIS